MTADTPHNFADLGMPFPLFEAPVVDATGFDQKGDCTVCGARRCAVFKARGEVDVVACYACLRAGRAPWTKFTEFGFVDAEHAAQGITHGTNSPPWPALGYDVVPHPENPASSGERWYSVRIAREHLEELLRTYSTWQGESWRFCCHQPAIFIGCWGIERWTDAARERGVEVAELIGEALDLRPKETSELCTWLGDGRGSLSTYVFRCASCRRLRGHHDAT